MDYKYNELDYAKLIYEKGFQTKHIPTELRLLAIYMKTILEYKPKKLKEQMYNFCSKNIPEYNRARHYPIINKAINQSSKKSNVLVKIDQIDCYDCELDYINSLQICDENGVMCGFEYDCKKVIFTLLCQMKLNKAISKLKNGEESKGLYFKGGNKKYNNLKSISKIPSKLKINDDVIYTLGQSGIVTVMFNGLIKLNFMEELQKVIENQLDLNIVVSVINFNNIGWYYDFYNDINKIKLCKYCEQPYKQTKSDILYCSEHKQYYTPIETKTIKCDDCGEEVEVDAKDTKTKRCEIHQKEYDKQRKRDYWNKNKDKINLARRSN